MQVHVRTNFASSKSAGDRSGAAAGASAVYLERVRDIVYWVVVEYRVSVDTLVRCVGGLRSCVVCSPYLRLSN